MTQMWIDVKPGLWRSIDGRYVILRTVLPEERPTQKEIFTLRKLDPEMVKAHPGTLGYFIAEAYTLDGAKRSAANDAWRDAQGTDRHVPEDLPALELARFFWPISAGTTQAGLAVVCEGGRIFARVVGMSRKDERYEPGTYAEIDITGLLEREAR